MIRQKAIFIAASLKAHKSKGEFMLTKHIRACGQNAAQKFQKHRGLCVAHALLLLLTGCDSEIESKLLAVDVAEKTCNLKSRVLHGGYVDEDSDQDDKYIIVPMLSNGDSNLCVKQVLNERGYIAKFVIIGRAPKDQGSAE